MTTAPHLSESDVKLEVTRLFSREHRSKLVALYGRGEAASLDTDGQVWQVIPTSCELDLRAHLPTPDDDGTSRRVYLVDWVEDALPLDIACRLAGGRVYHVERGMRLAGLFGARAADPGLTGSALAKLLLTDAVGGTLRKVTGLKVTKDDAWQRFLEARFRVPLAATRDAEAWLSWAFRSEGGPGFVRACAASDLLRAVRGELLAWLESGDLGPLGPFGWKAWESGEADRVRQFLVLLDATTRSGDPYLRGHVEGHAGASMPSLGSELRAALPRILEGDLLSALIDPSAEKDRRLLDEAERLAEAAGAKAACLASPWLPSAHEAREGVAARELGLFVSTPSADQLLRLYESLSDLSAHRLDETRRPTEHADARRMVARLAAWLLKRKNAPGLPRQDGWQGIIDLAREVAEEGGYLDWSRQALRGLRWASDAFGAAVRKLLACVDDQVRDDDRRFAHAYVKWVEAGKPSNDVVPIEHVTRRFVVPFLKGGPHRRLLIVVMDGMSQCAAIQLLHRLWEGRRWGPVAWRSEGWKGSTGLHPVLAVAPTLTEVSRAALFAGVATPSFGDQGTENDDARWGSNTAIREFVGDQALSVFFRRDILAGHDLNPKIKASVAGESRVVAVVVNAIDEQLKGSIQVSVDYSRTPIPALEALLSAAEGAERAVLLVADHGHIPGDAARVVSGRIEKGRPSGARWRALAEGEQPAPDEVALPLSMWRPKGWARIALPWDGGIVYRSPNHGEHGGASRAEVVAPAILIAPEWLDRVAGEDAGLSCRHVVAPEWWECRVATGAPSAPEPSAPAPHAQSVETSLITALRSSRVFPSHVEGVAKPEVEKVLTWLGVLADAGDALPASEFARLAGVRSHQVAGVVARMGILNADGFAIVEYDVAGRRVVLQRARLKQQFGIDR